MAPTCTNDTQENTTTQACTPLSKMPISLAHGIIRSTVLLIFLSISFFGNIILVLVLQRKPQLLQVTNRFIFNLLLTDLLQVALVAPWVVATSMPLFWPLNSHFCTALVSLTHLLAFASVNTIIVVSIDRYLSIIHPLSYPNKMTTRRGYMLLYGTWIVAILQSTPPLYGWGQAGFDERNALCSMIWGSSPSYLVVSVVSFIVIPLTVMIACYSVVFGAARQQHALLYNVKRHRLGVRVRDHVKNENEKEVVKDKFQEESEFNGQDEGEVSAKESGPEAEEVTMESSQKGQQGGGVQLSECIVEARGNEVGDSTKADKGHAEVHQCNIDLGEDDIELGEDDIDFHEGDVEAVHIPEPRSHQNSDSHPPLPRCYECKAARVIFLIIFSYVLSLGPYCFLAVLAVWVDVQTKVPQWVITIIIWLFFLQCCIHPYVYGYMHKTIKKEIHSVLRRLFCRKKRSRRESSHPHVPGSEAASERGTEGRIVPSHDSATSA